MTQHYILYRNAKEDNVEDEPRAQQGSDERTPLLRE